MAEIALARRRIDSTGRSAAAARRYPPRVARSRPIGPCHEKPAEQAVERLLRLAERPREDQNPLSVRDGEHAPAVEIAVAERHRRQECAATGGRGRGRVEKSRQRRRVGAHDVPVRADDLRDRARLARVGVEDRALLPVPYRLRRLRPEGLVDGAPERVLDPEVHERPEREEQRRHRDGEGGGEAPADGDPPQHVRGPRSR